MPRKQTKTIGNLLKDTSKLFHSNPNDAPYIPNIMEFCESKAYLGLPFPLYPIQKLVLRAFYRGTPGNTSEECLNMTEEEIELCHQYGLVDSKNGNILGKWNSNEIFKEMVLVWGRRSGKDFTISVIALYEAMKLLECKGGDPYRIYTIGSANPFTILTIANNKEQAKILYREIHGKLMSSPYFRDKYIPEGITNEKICLQTPQDRKDNEQLVARGLNPNAGSVQIETGHSNSNGLVGKQCYVLMLDEAGTYKRSGGPGSDEQLYGNLSPTTKGFVRKEIIYGDNGEILDTIRHYEGKVISISSPRGMDGVFYRLYNQAENAPNRLMCRLPTWIVNPTHTEASLRAEEQTMTDEKFRMEFGAEFSGTEGENFFDPDLVDAVFTSHQYRMRDLGQPGITYFAHLDPAVSSHNYALAIVHRQPFMNRETKKVDYHIVLDHMKLWTPDKGKPIRISEIDDYMIWLNKRFHFGLVTYDQWNTCMYLTVIPTLMGNKRAIDIQVGDQLPNRFGNIETVLAKQVDFNARCFKIRTKFGYEVDVTPNHPFWNGSEFVLARDCTIGDKLCLQDFCNFGQKDDVNSAITMGYLIAEGYISEKSKVIEFSNTDIEVLKDYEAVATATVGVCPKKYAYTKQKSHHRDAWKMVYRGDEFLELKDLGMTGDSYTKDVPQFVMEGNRATVAAFLSALYEGDGNVCSNPSALLVEYNTSSVNLAKNIHLLLLNFGIKASLKKYDNKFLHGKKYTFYRISIYGDNIDIFAKEIGFRSSRKNAELAEVLRLKNEVDLRPLYKTREKRFKGQRVIIGKKPSRSRQMWDRIVSIEPTTTTICHLEVSGDHTYISNGIISHNSQSSIEKLRKGGIPAQCARFSKHFKIQIYDELETLVNQERLKCPQHKTLRLEMLNLQRKYLNTGYRIYPKTEGEVRTDDCCVDIDSLVNTERGLIPIREVIVGDFVLTHLGNFKRVNGISLHSPSVQSFILKTQSGLPLKATANHPIEVYENGVRVWKALSDIKKGDFVVRSFDNKVDSFCFDLSNFVQKSDAHKHQVNFIEDYRVRDQNPRAKWCNRFIVPTESLGFLIGAYLAEGYEQDHGIAFTTHIKEVDYRKKISDAMNDVFGLKDFNSVRENTHQLTYNSNLVKKFFNYLFNKKRAISKEIPICFTRMDLPYQKCLIRGFYEGDGSHYNKTFTFTTASKRMALQFQQMLFRHDILSSFSISKRNGAMSEYRGRLIRCNSDLYNLRIREHHSYNKLATILDYPDRKEASLHHPQKIIKIGEVTWAFPVRAVVETTMELVANLAVDADHSYVVDGINTHNCDALAAACFNALKVVTNRLPASKLAYTGIVPSSNQHNWQSMSGPLGFGTGQQVWNALSRRDSYPRR